MVAVVEVSNADTHPPSWATVCPHGVDSCARSETTAVLDRARIEVSRDGPSGSINKTETVYLGVCLCLVEVVMYVPRACFQSSGNPIPQMPATVFDRKGYTRANVVTGILSGHSHMCLVRPRSAISRTAYCD